MIHFLGGAFVSPQPTIAYRYVLEQLAVLGYGVIATPFAVDFDYRKPASDIRDSFRLAQSELAMRGLNGDNGVPLVGMGHSLGALMQVLLDCESPEMCIQSGLALISYNNNEVDGAIPFFKELFVPALGPLEPLTRDSTVIDAFTQLRDSRISTFKSVRDITKGVQNALGMADDESFIPGVRPLVLKGLNDLEAAVGLVDQLPTVIASIAKGASEFEPTPTQMRELVSTNFQQPSPLVVKFDGDGIDQSDVLMETLPESLNAKLVTLSGSHVTPLAIDPNAPSTPLLPVPSGLKGAEKARKGLLENADALVTALDEYFTSCVASKDEPEPQSLEPSTEDVSTMPMTVDDFTACVASKEVPAPVEPFTEDGVTTPDMEVDVAIAIPDVMIEIQASETSVREALMAATNKQTETGTVPTSTTPTTITKPTPTIDIAIPEIMIRIQTAEQEAREARMAARTQFEDFKLKEAADKIDE